MSLQVSQECKVYRVDYAKGLYRCRKTSHASNSCNIHVSESFFDNDKLQSITRFTGEICSADVMAAVRDGAARESIHPVDVMYGRLT